MSGPSIHELLGLSNEITQPNAYQVLGLTLGESDQQVIDAAIEKRVRSLRKAKPSAPPAVWAKAARAIQTAQRVLADPEKKAELDAQYGIVHESQSAEPVDPLAALLPGTGVSSPSLGGIPPSGDGPGPAAHATPVPDPRVTEPPAQPLQANPAQPIPASSAPRVRHRPVRQRQSSWGGLLISSISVLLLAAIAGGLGFVFLKGGGVKLVKNKDGFQISTNGDDVEDGRTSRTAPPRRVNRRPRGDGILEPPPSPAPHSRSPDLNLDPAMGVNADDAPGMSLPDQRAGQPNNGMPEMPPPVSQGSQFDSPSVPGNTTPSPGMTPESPSTESPSTTEPDASEPGAGTGSPDEPPAPPATGTAPATPEETAAGDTAIAAARQAITHSQWQAMKELAETAEAKAVTETQKRNAETLFQFADLATFYRGAIRRAMSDLVAGNEIKLTDSLTFLVKGSSADKIILYRNKREYAYSFDELPLSVAHALAPFQLNVASPEGQAAKAVFQVLSPKTTPGHHEQSVKILRSLHSVKGADPKRLADFIESIR